MYMHTNLACTESETSDVESASNPTKPLRRRGRAQKGSSDVVAGTMCIDCTLLYMYTNLACIESETSDVESASKSASNPTKPLRRCGRAQKGSSDVVAGTMCIDCTLLYMYTNIACIESETSNVESASNPTKPLRRCGRAQKGSSDVVTGTMCIDCTLLYMYTNLACIESETSNVESASNPTKPLRRFGRAQKGSSDLITGTMCTDCTLLYMYTNLACIESETSDVESASNPTKPLRRCGRVQKGSPDLVAGRLLIVPLCTCLLHCFVFLLCCVTLPCLSME